MSHMLECKPRMVNHEHGVGTHDKHSKVTLSEWNIGLLDGLNRLHQVPGLQLEYWWSCTQHGSKPQWSHMLECKQRMVNNKRGVVRVVPGGVQHVRSIAGGCRALASLWVKFHATTSNLTVLRHSDNYQHSNPKHAIDKHSKVTLSEWNIGLLDGLNRLHQVPGLQLEYGGVVHNMGPNHNGRTGWSASTRMVNHEHGVVRVVPRGIKHVRLIAVVAEL
ncbi:hypothetical protein DFH27DRAFT_617224 [Peziza echinospora]|nr:hypothetical protein DFH27DRAFT_617224 [Peziza echinospora]